MCIFGLGLVDCGSISCRNVVHARVQTKVCLANLLCLVPCEGNLSTGLSPTAPHRICDHCLDSIIHVRYSDILTCFLWILDLPAELNVFKQSIVHQRSKIPPRR